MSIWIACCNIVDINDGLDLDNQRRYLSAEKFRSRTYTYSEVEWEGLHPSVTVIEFSILIIMLVQFDKPGFKPFKLK